MGTQEHWEAIYGKKRPQELSWYLPHLGHSLQFVERAGLSPTAAIIDVGGGASTLVDDLIARGYLNLTVLDLSEGAIAQARSRLGPDAAAVKWLVGDITEVGLATISSEDSSSKWATTARCITPPGAANRSSSTATAG